MAKVFIKRVENFTCEQCGKEVKGNGYTNHCPFCLWSKHVDLSPGDRLGTCKGMMRPDHLVIEKSQYILINVCVKCGASKRNVISPNDSFDEVTRIQKAFAEKQK